MPNVFSAHLIKSVLSIIKNLNADEYVLMVPQNSTEGAEKVFQANNLKYYTFHLN